MLVVGGVLVVGKVTSLTNKIWDGQIPPSKRGQNKEFICKQGVSPRSERVPAKFRTRYRCRMMATVLATFDVDGTLIESEGAEANKVHKEAFASCFRQVFGVETTIDVCKHHGLTDPLVIQLVMRHHGKSEAEIEEKMSRAQGCMIEYAERAASASDEAAGVGLRALPGAASVLSDLKSKAGYIVALTTGNLQPIGWLKMRSLELLPHFSVPNIGGFGTDYWGKDTTKGGEDRAELLRFARKRAEASAGQQIAVHVHFGDSPYDIRAAEIAGCLAVGVTTGVFR